MYLGLDLGTSGIKAMLVDENFATIGVGRGAERQPAPSRLGPSRPPPTGSPPASR